MKHHKFCNFFFFSANDNYIARKKYGSQRHEIKVQKEPINLPKKCIAQTKKKKKEDNNITKETKKTLHTLEPRKKKTNNPIMKIIPTQN